MRTNIIILVLISLNLLLETANFAGIQNVSRRCIDPHEYQLTLDRDSTYIYWHGAPIGKVPSYTWRTIDSVIWFSDPGQKAAGYK